MKTTRYLDLKGNSSAGDCGPEEGWGSNWSQFMSTDTSLSNSYKNTWNYSSSYNYDNAQEKMDQFHDRFVSNLAAGSGWAVQQHAAGYDGGGQAITIWLFDPSATLQVIDHRLHTSTGNVQFESFAYNPSVNCRWQAMDYNNYNNNYEIFGVDNNNPLFFVASDNIDYPTDFTNSAQLPTSPSSPLKYVALGDSFSSGEGNPPYVTGTDTTGINECHRSNDAYPNILASLRYLNLTTFAACSGATTDNITTTGQWNEITQYNAISSDTNIVTLSIGGNDIGFKDFASACTTGGCDFSTSIYETTHNHVIYDLPTKLFNVLDTIKVETQYNPNVKIYVVGYPYIVPAEMPTDSDCMPFNGGDNNPDPTLNSGAAVRTLQTDLNNTIHQAVTDFDSAYSTVKFQYVDPNGVNSPFLGHDWCSNDSYFYELDAIHQITSYHPTVNGQKAYAEVLRFAIN